MKKLISVLLILLMLTTAFGCIRIVLLEKVEPKEFSKNGLTITLTNRFTEQEGMGDYNFGYVSIEVAVSALKESFSRMAGLKNMPLKEYTQRVISANEKDCEVIEEDGLTYFTFVEPYEGDDYSYFSCVYKGSEAFWMVQFSCLKTKYEDQKADFVTWAKSVKVE